MEYFFERNQSNTALSLCTLGNSLLSAQGAVRQYPTQFYQKFKLYQANDQIAHRILGDHPFVCCLMVHHIFKEKIRKLRGSDSTPESCRRLSDDELSSLLNEFWSQHLPQHFEFSRNVALLFVEYVVRSRGNDIISASSQVRQILKHFLKNPDAPLSRFFSRLFGVNGYCLLHN